MCGVLAIINTSPKLEALASEMKIYNSGGNICDYFDGEGSYFDVERNMYTDSQGRIAYCIEPDIIGAELEGTTGYESGADLQNDYPDLIKRLDQIANSGYPMAYIGYNLHNGNAVDTVGGLVINGRFFECTVDEARAATAFSIHKSIYEYYLEQGVNKSSYEILSYRNGTLAKHNLVEICEAMLSCPINKEESHLSMTFGTMVDGEFCQESDNASAIISEGNGIYFTWVKIESNNSYINDIFVNENKSTVDVNIVDVIRKNPCTTLVKIQFKYGKVDECTIGLNCEGVRFSSGAIYFSHKNYQDVMVIPENEKISDECSVTLFSGRNVLHKYDFVTKKPIKGVKFGLYSDVNCTLLEQEFVTDESGCVWLDNLPEEKFFIKELECRPGYILDDNVYEININKITPNEITINNYPYRLFLQLIKNDTKTGDFLQGDESFGDAIYGI